MIPVATSEEQSTDNREPQMSDFYPLRFQPIFQSYIWGGRRLESVLNKTLPDDRDFAESWEIVDHKDGQSVVVDGPWEGYTLSQLVRQYGAAMLGKHHPQDKFPLLFKFLDCNRNLSVQVHPNDTQGANLTPPDLGKTEAWVIMAAEPGSVLYAGLKDGIDRDQFEASLREGTAAECLHQIEPNVGDCIFIPAGTVHALGEGLVVAEIQQSSNTTFRLFDWNRVGADGKSRPLHIEQGVAVTDFARGPVEAQVPQATGRPNVERLVDCDKFVLDRVRVASQTQGGGPTQSGGLAQGGGHVQVGGDDACHLIAVLSGEVTLDQVTVSEGETALLPAACGAVDVVSGDGAVMLDMYLP